MTDVQGRIRAALGVPGLGAPAGEAALGGDVAVGSEGARAAFAVDGVLPKAVAYPRQPEQVAALLALAAAEGWGVLPWGGGSGMGRGNAPARYDVALSLSRLTAVHDHDAENLTLTADAGLTLAAAARHLASRHQQLAIGQAHSAHTLGGAIAAGALAPQRLLYGDLRDQLLGLRVALPDGSLVRYGRKVLKNVAGYDMNKLFLGSQGLLGVIVEATFKLFALPDEARLLRAAFPRAEDALACAAALYRSQLLPAALLAFDDALARHAEGAGAAPSTTPNGSGGLHLAVAFEGRAPTVQRQLSDTRALLARQGAGAMQEAERLTPTECALLEAPPAADGSPAALRLRVGTVPTALGGWRQRVCAALRELRLAPLSAMDYGAGQLRVGLDAPESALPALAAALRGLRAGLEAERGFLCIEAAPPALKARLDALGAAPGEQHLMRLLKARFDPRGVLAPGRYLDAQG